MPIFYAFAAALCNSTIGVFSKLSMSNLTPEMVAFGKCILSFAILSLACSTSASSRKKIATLATKWPKIVLLSFLGIFVLYFFETAALAKASIGTVSFTVYGAGILTIFCGYLFLNEKLGFFGYFGALMIMVGVLILSSGQANLTDLKGVGLAFLAGAGYSFFLILSRVFQLGSGISLLWWMMGIGSAFLSIPVLTSFQNSIEISQLLYLLPLSIVPTIGGFYFTTKAIDKAKASMVQLIEMSEPIFAITFGWLLFSEIPTKHEIIGGCFTLLGLIVVGSSNSLNSKFLRRKRQR